MTTVFHPGEVAMQRSAGVAERLQEIGSRVIRDRMPEQHREFFEQLPTLLVGSVDARDHPWASMLTGWPGFVETPDDRHVRIDALPRSGDPLHDALRVGARIGLLGLEPAARRRNRVNGRVTGVDAHGFELEVEQSFGNCPQYIQARSATWVGDGDGAVPVPQGARLAGPAAALVARADTLFIASTAPGEGADVSHRGGKPGFVRIEQRDERSVLTMPDFRGNFFFNTLGNLSANPRAGLLFVDHETGDTLQLGARVQIIHDGREVHAFAGAQRLLRFEVEKSLWTAHALPLRWSAPQLAPQLAATGHW
jgi:predicted pyridoxine 5'-phosphate oxidase superfamily flavin-nucleotide-binding protein